MIYITTCIVAMIFVFATLKKKEIYNPLSIFTGLWTLICFLAMLQLYGMYDYTNYAPFIILLGVIFVSAGYYFGERYKIQNFKSIPYIGIKINHNYVIREKLYVVLLGTAIAVYCVILTRVLALYAYGYDASTIREFYRYSGETASSGLATEYIYGGSKALKYLHTYYANTITMASIPIMATNLIDKAKITKVSLLSLIALGLSCIVKFGRFSLIYALVCIALAFFIKGRTLSKKTRKRIIRISVFAIVAVVAAFIILNNLRNSSSEFGLLQNFYAYFSIEVPLLDHWIEYVNEHGYYSLGFAFISGCVANLMNVFAKIGVVFHAYKVNELLTYKLVDHFINIFPAKSYNAYVSMFFAFYLDFREIGVIFGSFFYGFVIAKAYKKAKQNSASLAIFLLLFYSLFTSFIRWQFVIVNYCFAFIVLRILLKEDKNKNGVK